MKVLLTILGMISVSWTGHAAEPCDMTTLANKAIIEMRLRGEKTDI